MKVLLTNPPWIVAKKRGVVAGSRWSFLTGPGLEGGYKPFPFFLAYAAAVLEQQKHDVGAIDACALDLDEEAFIGEIRKKSPDILVMEIATASAKPNLMLCKRIKEEVGCSVVLCGPHVSALPREILLQNEFIDYVLIGEYEFTLRGLIQALENGENLNGVKGIALRRNGDVIITPRRPPIDPLDQLPYPARHLFPMDRYNEPFCRHSPNLQMLTSRGCPYRCIFCLWPQVLYGERRHRAHTPERVANEVEHVVGKYHPQEIYFDDDTGTISKKRILDICKLFQERGINIKWSIMGHILTVDKEMLEKMAEVGCVGIKFGVESADLEILRKAKKDMDLNKVGQVVRWCKDLDIKCHLTFTFGLPGETKKSIEKTIKFALGLDPDSMQFSMTVPFPGTELYELAKHNGWLVSEDWDDYDGARCSVISYPWLHAKEIENAFTLATSLWALRKTIKRGEVIKFVTSIVKSQGPKEALLTVVSRLPYLVKYPRFRSGKTPES